MHVYRRKPDEVHAEVYQPGMEDTFGYRSRFHAGFCLVCNGSGQVIKPDPDRNGELVPLILTTGGYKEIREGDYIITTIVEGKKDVCSADTFELLYENAE